ncbi:amphi-Trp domain-containing protein [Haloarcula salinisoli]|uniref:amphi-Trp domain-containing protein n=1 Tax=Haloarcula salinisoli TaxID=2487746 RepID=UPI002E2A9D89|nr:amphi-Trp domain-containing protein [Halomicroarcula salinisoli]
MSPSRSTCGLADTLESGSEVTLRAGDQSVTTSPPSEVELEWPESASRGSELSIE